MIKVDTFEDIIAYFELLVSQTSKIKSFKFGGYNRILESQRSEIDYPCLFLQLPEKGLDGVIDGGITKEYTVSFALISSVEVGDYEKQDELVFLTFEKYIEQLIIRIIKDFDFNLQFQDFEMDPIFGFTHDNAFGWQVKFDLDNDSSICKDDSFWDLEDTTNYFASEFAEEFK